MMIWILKPVSNLHTGTYISNLHTEYAKISVGTSLKIISKYHVSSVYRRDTGFVTLGYKDLSRLTHYGM